MGTKVETRLLSERAQLGLQGMLRFGSFCRFIPYELDNETGQLFPAAVPRITLFNFQFVITCLYLLYMGFRIVVLGEFSLLAGLWTVSTIATTVAFFTLSRKSTEVMHFANRLLLNGFPIASGSSNFLFYSILFEI